MDVTSWAESTTLAYAAILLSGGHPLRHPQLGAATPRIAKRFLIRRTSGLLRPHRKPRIVAKYFLHAPIFQRMKANERESAAGPQSIGNSRQRQIERLQLMIHGNSQCLKGSCRRVDPITRPRHAAANELR